MRAREFIQEDKSTPFQGLDMSLEVEKDDGYVDDDDVDNQTIYVRATANGRELGHVLFTRDYDSQGLVLNPQDLEVDERYRGQGIAAAMYDYVKSQGYRIRRSGQQTDAGAGFWDKHKPGKNVWEQGVTEDIDPYRLERLDPQTRRVLTRMADHKDPGSWLSASEAYAMSLGLQYKNRDPRGWEQDVQRYVDLYRQYSGQGVTEVQILSKVKSKGEQPSNLPKFGREISPKQEQHYLGQKISKYRGHEIWRDYIGGQVSYHLFDPNSRTVVLTAFGSRYKENPDSFIIAGLYAAPGNPIRAHEFYRHLIRDVGLTLISDYKQSPGGQKVWQRLERYPDINIFGFDTRTEEVLNFTARDEEMYAVPSTAVKGRDMQQVARDIRLVAVAR
jgi:GNAT superfamily N-acetyltransferase